MLEGGCLPVWCVSPVRGSNLEGTRSSSLVKRTAENHPVALSNLQDICRHATKRAMAEHHSHPSHLAQGRYFWEASTQPEHSRGESWVPAAVRRQDVASGEYPKASRHQLSTASGLPQFPCSCVWHDLGHLLKKAVGGRLAPRSHWCCGPKAVRNATEVGEGNLRLTPPTPQPCMTLQVQQELATLFGRHLFLLAF